MKEENLYTRYCKNIEEFEKFLDENNLEELGLLRKTEHYSTGEIYVTYCKPDE